MALTGTQKDVATLIGVSRETVRLRVKDGTLPGLNAEGRYDLAAAVQAFIRYQIAQALAQSGPGASDADQRERYDRLRADMVELDLAERRGETTTVDQLERRLGEACERAAARLKALPNRLAPMVVGVGTVQDALAAVEPIVAEVWAELYAADEVPDEALAEDAA